MSGSSHRTVDFDPPVVEKSARTRSTTAPADASSSATPPQKGTTSGSFIGRGGSAGGEASSAVEGANKTSRAATTSKKMNKRETIVPTNQDTISKKLGYVVDEFKCYHNNFQGILYAGPLGLVFLGRFLLFEWTVVLKWDDVIRVSTKYGQQQQPAPKDGSGGGGGGTTTNGSTGKGKQQQPADPTDNGIRIETRGENAKTYDFERFFDAPKALTVLASLHNDSVLGLSDLGLPSPRILSRGLRRMNSDPLQISNLFNFDDVPTGVEGNDVVQSNRRQLGYGGGSLDLGGTGMVPMPGGDDGSSTTVDRSNGPRRHSIVKASTYDFSPHNLFDGAPYSDHDGETTAPGASSSTSGEQATPRRSCLRKPTRGDDVATEWRQVLSEIAEYGVHVIKDRELNCSLDRFVDTFVNDDSPHSIVEFMRENGEMDIHASEWKDDDAGLARSRTVEYTHPVDVPMAPPTARARKEQTCRKYGDHGLIFETRTFVSDVPMTDCFYVADAVVVEARREGKNVVSLNMHFDIRFVKSTMFQSLIARTARNEFEKYFQTMESFMAKSLGDDSASAPIVAQAPVSVPPPRKRQSGVSDRWSQLSTILLGLVLLMQAWIIMDLRSVKFEMRQLAVATTISDIQQVCGAGSDSFSGHADESNSRTLSLEGSES
jgi:VAD1 Analog of StAR-related lipid transfer domain